MLAKKDFEKDTKGIAVEKKGRKKISQMKMLFEQNINPAVFSYTANGVPQLQIPVKNQ